MAELKKILQSQDNQNSKILQLQLQEYLHSQHHQVSTPSATPLVSSTSVTPGGTNLITDILDNKLFNQGAMNLNGNGNSNVYSPSTQSITDNMTSTLNMPPMDNLDPCPLSPFIAFSTNQLTSSESSSLDATNNKNLNNNPGTGAHNNVNVETTDNLNNINLNRMSPSTSIMSPVSIKQEVDPVFINDNANTNISKPIEAETDTIEMLINNPDNLQQVDRILSDVCAPSNSERLLLINQVTDVIVEAHMATCEGTKVRVEQAFDRIANTASSSGMPDMSKMMSKMSMDGPAIMQKFMSAMVPEISKVVKFGKQLPGFSEVDEGDQIKLIKQGSFKVMLVRQSTIVNTDNDTMLDPTLSMATPRAMMKKLPMGKILDKVFMIAKYLEPLHLTDAEYGMLAAILLFCPDREDLTNVVAIRKIQQLYQQALFIMMKDSHKDTYEHRFESLMKLLPFFHKVNNEHSQHLNDIKLKSPQAFNEKFPALIREVFQH